MRPLLVLLLDGLGDRACDAHGGRTANEAGWTPHLDALASRGSCGLLWPLGPGRAPSSELAHWALLGYRPDEFPGRAVLEALGHGRTVAPDEVVAHAALRRVEARDGALWVVPGRPPGTLLERLGRVTTAGLAFSLERLTGGDGLLRIAGGAHDRVTDSEPFFRERYPILRPRALVPEAKATARGAELWSRWAARVLTRQSAAVTLKWWGRAREAPMFRERHGVEGSLVGASPFLAGLAAVMGLRSVRCHEGPDAAGDMRRRLDLARERLDRGDTFVFCHLKATDEAGHTKDPRRKLRTIEAVDRALAGLEARFPEAVVCVTGDHATPSAPEVIHSGDPVPLVVAGPGVRADRVRRFGELDCADGLLGRLEGEDLMPVLLNAADRPLFRGSRATAVPGAAGTPHPADLDALEA